MACGCNKNKGALPTRNLQMGNIRNFVQNVRQTPPTPKPGAELTHSEKVANNQKLAEQQAAAERALKEKEAFLKKQEMIDKKNNNLSNENINKVMGMSKGRLELEKKRRDAIRKALGK